MIEFEYFHEYDEVKVCRNIDIWVLTREDIKIPRIFINEAIRELKSDIRYIAKHGTGALHSIYKIILNKEVQPASDNDKIMLYIEDRFGDVVLSVQLSGWKFQKSYPK